MNKGFVAIAAVAVLGLAGCGSSSSEDHEKPTTIEDVSNWAELNELGQAQIIRCDGDKYPCVNVALGRINQASQKLGGNEQLSAAIEAYRGVYDDWAAECYGAPDTAISRIKCPRDEQTMDDNLLQIQDVLTQLGT